MGRASSTPRPTARAVLSVLVLAVYLDFTPGPIGTPGQLVVFGKGVFGLLVAPSFESAVELYARALESGEWLVKDGEPVRRAKRRPSFAQYACEKLRR